MNSVLVFAVLFGVVFTLAQGSAIKTHQTQSLQTCQQKKIDNLIDKIVADTLALKDDAYKAYENAYAGVLKCIVSSFTTIVSCVEGVVTDNLSDLETEAEKYLTTVEALVQKLITLLQACV